MTKYRMFVGKTGIYEAVDRDCPRNDPRRIDKPDGSWLPKVGKQYPGAISFWTDAGLQHYVDSGLLQWHASVVEEQVNVLIAKIEKPLYSDPYQIICNPNQIQIIKQIPLAVFLESIYLKKIRFPACLFHSINRIGETLC